jgi:hypothetical protein
LKLLIYTQSVGLLGRGISLSQGRYLHTELLYSLLYSLLPYVVFSSETKLLFFLM